MSNNEQKNDERVATFPALDRPVRLAVLLSGSGTTLQNFIDLIDLGELDAEICCVVSSRSNAFGLERANKNGIPNFYALRKQFPTSEEHCAALNQFVIQHSPDLILLAGFMVLYYPPESMTMRVMNVHPALLPSFGGKGFYGHHVHEAVLNVGAKVTGATVHFVDGTYDTGPIILQKALRVLEDDTPESLAERVQEVEREIYPEAVRLFAQGRLRVEGRRVRILPPREG